MNTFNFSNKITDILGKNYVNKYKFLYFLGAISSILEIIGVTSVLPFFL